MEGSWLRRDPTGRSGGMFDTPVIEPLGDAAVIVRFGDEIDPVANDHVIAFADDLMRNPLPAQRDVVVAFASVALLYDPVVAATAMGPYESMAEAVRERLAQVELARERSNRVVEIPVCYDRILAPDIETVAARVRVDVAELAALHSGRAYRVYMIGFTPGFPYLGDLDERIAMPRRATPLEHVPAGSVAIGGHQTGIYPNESPAGWWVIGRTPTRLFDPSSDPPSTLHAGDTVRFRLIGRDEFDDLSR